MKHKARKSKSAAATTNGVSEKNDENGQISDQEVDNNEQVEDKKRRSSSKRKSSSGAAKNAPAANASSDEEDESKKSKRTKRGKDVEDDDDEPEKKKRSKNDDEVDEKKKKGGKRKSVPRNVEHDEENDEESEEEAEEKKKKSKKKVSASKENDEEKSEEEEDEPQYEVEAILDEKNIKGVKHYLIRWKGYEPESDTWEPESTLNCPDLIADYKSKKGKTKTKSKSATTTKAAKKINSDETWDENEDFEVERILDVYFKKNGQREFLVLWKGYPASQSSWEPEENMDCKDLITRFMDKVDRAREADQRELRVNRTHTDRFTLTTSDTGRRLSKRNQKKQRVHYHDAE